MARWCHGQRGSWRSEYCGEPASGDGESLHKHDTMRQRALDAARHRGPAVCQSICLYHARQESIHTAGMTKPFVPCLIVSKRWFLIGLLFQLPFFTVPSSQAVASDST